MTKRLFWLGLSGVAIACGGAAHGAGPDESASGGSPIGGTATGGMNPGGSDARGGSAAKSGAGNQTTGAVTGSSGVTSGGVSGTPHNDGGAAGAGAPGTGGDGGAPGTGPHTKDPITVCGSNTLAGGIYCSKDAFCEALECGEPWSLFDAEGCARKLCWSDDACASGSRCVPAPVAGKFDKTCFSEYDGCEDSSGTCECVPYECGGLALCLSEQEFPPEGDCPVESLSCTELRSTAANLKAYADGEDFFLMVEASSTVNGRVEACRAKVDGLLTNCN